MAFPVDDSVLETQRQHAGVAGALVGGVLGGLIGYAILSGLTNRADNKATTGDWVLFVGGGVAVGGAAGYARAERLFCLDFPDLAGCRRYAY